MSQKDINQFSDLEGFMHYELNQWLIKRLEMVKKCIHNYESSHVNI
jgi:hypothetical protein